MKFTREQYPWACFSSGNLDLVRLPHTHIIFRTPREYDGGRGRVYTDETPQQSFVLWRQYAQPAP